LVLSDHLHDEEDLGGDLGLPHIKLSLEEVLLTLDELEECGKPCSFSRTTF